MTKKDKPLPPAKKSDVVSSRGDRAPGDLAMSKLDIDVVHTPGNVDVWDHKRAQEIAEALKLPKEWNAAQVQAFTNDLEAGLGWQRGLFPYSAHANDPKLERKRRMGEREGLERKAGVFEAAAQALHDNSMAVGAVLHWANEYAPGPEETRASLEKAAALLLALEPFPLKGVLLALAREARFQAEYTTMALRLRGNFTDDRLVETVAGILTNHGLKPTAYRDKVKDEARGNLVVASAMIRGESADGTTEAFWVVRARDRVRRRWMELDRAFAERKE